MKQHYDVRVKPKTFAVGDLVWYYYPRKYTGRSPMQVDALLPRSVQN